MKTAEKTIIVLLMCLVFSNIRTTAQITPLTNAQKADSAAIVAEVGRITQAFINGDVETVYRTHSEDWSGFLSDNQQKPVKGVDGYMKANGFAWPPPPGGYTKQGNNSNLTYKMYNIEIVFTTPDVGIISFMLDYPRNDGKTFNKLRIMDVFTKRNGTWIQTASYTAQDPTAKTEQQTKPANISDQGRQQILAAREAVWRAWFGGDMQKLEKLIPEEAIAIDGGNENWDNRSRILEGAKKFAESGAKLTRLEFPRTEMQVYGNTVIIYTSYLFETEKDGKKSTTTGNGIEVFVRRGGAFVNTGWILAHVK